MYIFFTDRQTDILLTEIKVITDLFVIVMREIYVHVHVYIFEVVGRGSETQLQVCKKYKPTTMMT